MATTTTTTEHETAIVTTAKSTDIPHSPSDEDINTDPTWSKHPLLSTVIWLLGGYSDPIQQSNSGSSLGQPHGSGDSLLEARDAVWGSKDSLMITSEVGDVPVINHGGTIQLKPKIMNIVGDRDSTELKGGKEASTFEDGSPSCSPSWGWYVSTGTTPQSGATPTLGRQ